MKHRCFLSNYYVLSDLVISVNAALVSSLVVFFSTDRILFSTLVFFWILGFFLIFGFLLSPAVYKTVELGDEGVRLGKKFVKYPDIKFVSVSRGYVCSYFGFRGFENFTGIPQHFDVYVEDMICINCSFPGIDRRLPKDCIMVPRNKRTEEFLSKHCSMYNGARADFENRIARGDKPEFNKKAFIFLLCGSIFISLVFSLIVMLASPFTFPHRVVISFLIISVFVTVFLRQYLGLLINIRRK